MCLSLELEIREMKIYKVNLKIDTGYDRYYRVCILYADNAKNAKAKADKYINSRLHGETYADVENVAEIKENDSGIIYQDYFENN